MANPLRVVRSIRGRLRSLRAHPLLNPVLRMEVSRERAGHPVDDDHEPHIRAAVEWLVRAQDATPDDGVSRGYSLAFSPYYGARGWQPSYPETTGYIIPTLFAAASRLDRSELGGRAVRAADWEAAIQLPDGAVQGGVVGHGTTPAVFNTGQVMLGWLAALWETGDDRFIRPLLRAGTFLLEMQDDDGHWRRGNSEFARKDSTLYNARVAWALAEAGERLEVPAFSVAASRNLEAVANLQRPNGWFPDCCLSDETRPLLHTIAYTIRGLLEGGRVLQDERLVAAAALTSRALIGLVRPDGAIPGRLNEDWSAAVEWNCLTGNVQMANNWMRLHAITGESAWLEPVASVLNFVKRTQNRTSTDPGLRGGIKGSAPITGGYGRNETLNWATKYFVDALMRHDTVTGRWSTPLPPSFVLA